MKKIELDILKYIYHSPFINQRILAEESHYSLGSVNKALKSLIYKGYLLADMSLTKQSQSLIANYRPKRAIILAAGFGMRMVPINMATPKSLIEIHGEVLIERMIRQLKEVGIHDIYIVVGFLKERFEYLIDEYGVTLIVNEDYGIKNNLHSLTLAKDYLSNAYIIPGDLWCKTNPFAKEELYAWYMVMEGEDSQSEVRINRKLELVKREEGEVGNPMIGIAYLTDEISKRVENQLSVLDQDPHYDHQFWEAALYEKDKMIVHSKVVHHGEVIEINTYEQLREIDQGSNHLQSDAIAIIEKSLGVSRDEIVNIQVLKKGMTNRSFLFSCRGESYIMRIPGEGTDLLINRKGEADVYQKLQGYQICDDIFYINAENGYKITKFISDTRVCDSDNEDDLKLCMDKLRDFHQLNLQVDHEFDLFEQIEFYESLWEGKPSIYRDYQKTKKNIYSLKAYIDTQNISKCLTHIDAVADNFLITPKGEVRLIDWEYAGVQDPHVDIAMFCIYSLYQRSKIDKLIDLYFQNECPGETRLKIYAYIAVCGLLWSNWCEYKFSLGVEFGEYSIRQYRYAKEFFVIFKEAYDESR